MTIDSRPLSADETLELEAFLREHHPPLAEEFSEMRRKGLQRQLPILYRLVFEDMRRFQNGESTRNITFLAHKTEHEN